MIPVYGFLEGDTIGLLVLADEVELVAMTAAKVQAAARLRARLDGPIAVFVNDRRLDLDATVQQAGIKPLDRLDVRRGAVG
jgi:hypothetical protein